LLSTAAALWYVWFAYFTPEQRAARHRLSEADSKSDAAIDQRLKSVREMFARGRKGSKTFAEEALSWSGKWALIKGTLALGDCDAHREFLTEAFAKHIFSKDELKNELEGAIRAYLHDLEEIENEMLVQLRADLADLDHSEESQPSYLSSDDAFRQEYQRLAKGVTRTLQMDLGVSLGREIGVIVASEVAAQAAIQAAKAAAAEM